ncbi:MAG: NCS2 family permease [Acidobacteria bacterium]|nr:NCS2 family permease [Acidobacteriota bacterium]
MAYILFANPTILGAAGVPFEAAVAATALGAGVCSILMGVTANFPLALASGMGLNAVVAFQIAPVAGSWQAAMGLVVLDGIVVTLLVVLGLREAVMNAIPVDLRRAIGVGIGLFIAFIGAVNARLVVVPPGTIGVLAKDPTAVMPPVTHGTLQAPETAVALVGLVVIGYLMWRKFTGALVVGILLSTLVALVMGVAAVPGGDWLRVPSFATVFAADVRTALAPRLLPLLLALVLVDFFDTIGTVTAVAEASGLHGRDSGIPRLRPILFVDSVSASIGGLLGASSVTSYIESAAGVAEGARTGLHSVFVGVMFLLAIFAAPLAGIVPAAATAPALIVVGFLMCHQIVRIDFTKLDTALPAFVTFIVIPFTYSISHGIGYGFIAFVAIKLLSGRVSDVHPLMYGTAAAFAAYFIAF